STAPMYLFTEADLLKQPWAFQPRGGMVREGPNVQPSGSGFVHGNSPAIPIQLGAVDRYVDSTVRVLACLQRGSFVSSAFGPYELSLVESGGINIDKGESSYRLSIGKLRAGRQVQLASKF